MSYQDQSLQESVEALQKALEAGSNNYKPMTAALQVKDEMETAKKYLQPSSLIMFSKKAAKSLIVTDDKGVVAQCVYFAVRVPSNKTEDAVRKLSEVANELVSKGYIHSILAPMSSLELAQLTFQVRSSAVFFFPLIKFDKVEEVKQTYETISVEEGGVGNALLSLEPELKSGEFLAEARVTHHMGYAVDQDLTALLYGQIAEYLKFLPSGTKLISAEKRAITDLSVPYELKFFNPRLQKVKRVELEWIREVAFMEDSVDQFNLFIGIKYFGEGGKRLYHYHSQE